MKKSCLLFSMFLFFLIAAGCDSSKNFFKEYVLGTDTSNDISKESNDTLTPSSPVRDNKASFTGYFNGKSVKIDVFYIPQWSAVNADKPLIISNSDNDKTVKLQANKEYGVYITFEVDGQFIFKQVVNAKVFRDDYGNNTAHLVYYDTQNNNPRYDCNIYDSAYSEDRWGISTSCLGFEYNEIGQLMQDCLPAVQTYCFNAGARKDLSITFKYKPTANGTLQSVYTCVLHIEVD